jgi:hypothetical protein
MFLPHVMQTSPHPDSHMHVCMTAYGWCTCTCMYMHICILSCMDSGYYYMLTYTAACTGCTHVHMHVMGFHSPGRTYCHGVEEQEPLLEHPSTRQTFPHLYDRPRFARLASRKPLPRPRSASLPHELIQEQYIEMSSPLDYEPVIQRTSSRKGLSSTLV